MSSVKASTFIETFQFVEQKPVLGIQNVVPNHILESKIYAKIQQNAAVKATPAVVHFGGFESGKTLQTTVSLCNVTHDVMRMHIIPPQSKHFHIRYTKPERLVPGMTMNCIVEFTADEYRYYYDAIRIHCPGEDNLIIPIHAFPVMDASDFPTQLKFPSVTLGERFTHTLSLRCHVPVDFEFELKKLQDNDAFFVTPLSGVIPAMSSAEVVVTYQPSACCTSIMILQLNVSQFNFKPIVCNITGYCKPASTSTTMITNGDMEMEKRVCSPLERSRLKKRNTFSKSKTKFTDQFEKPKKLIMKDGIRFPERLDTVHHVSAVLIQTPGKLQLKELIEAEKSASGRQMKETKFDQAIRKNVYEERQNQLRWQRRLGDTPIQPSDRGRVVAERSYSWQVYKDQRGDPHPEDEKLRTATEAQWRRTVRLCNEVAEEGIQFDLYANNPWSSRHGATDRFAQAARKIILRNRAKKNLTMLNSFLVNWNRKQAQIGAGEENSGKGVKTVPTIDEEDLDAESSLNLRPALSLDKVTHAKYPFYVTPNKKDEMAPDALNEVITYETQVEIIAKIPYFNLQVPQQFLLLGYEEHDVQLGYDYVQPTLARKLRTGATEEIIKLKKTYTMPTEEPRINGNAPSTEVCVKDIKKLDTDDQVSTVINLVAPEAMFQPIDYPPLHIFNATPGLQSFQSPAPYAEVDADYHLCPLPKFTATSSDPNPLKQTQKRYLDREDIIKGTLSWKKFPSQGLTSLANTATLTNVWVPRWSDPFDNSMLPLQVPVLQSGLAEDDALYHSDAEDLAEEPILLTPEMVAAQFGLEALPSVRQSDEDKTAADTFPFGNKMPATNIPVSTNGPVPREKREQELDFFLSRKSNRLGQKIQARMDQLNSLTNREDLVFN